MPIAEERQLLRQERSEIESSFKEKENTCLKNFSATSCINEAKQQKSKALAKVKQRELTISDEERALKKTQLESKNTQTPLANVHSKTQAQNKAEKQKPIESSVSQQDTNEQANKAQLQRQQQKQSQALAQAKLRIEKQAEKKVESDKKANRRSTKNQQESTKAAKYQSKIAAAQARKNALGARNANPSKQKAAPLPLPDSK